MFMQSSFKIFNNMKSYKLSFSLRSSDDTSIAIEPIFKNLLHLVGLQLWSSLRRCWVSLSLLPSGLDTAAPSTQRVWGRLESGCSFTGSLTVVTAEKATLLTMPHGSTFDWAGYRLGSFNMGDEELVLSSWTSEAAFLLQSLPLLGGDWGLHPTSLPESWYTLLRYQVSNLWGGRYNLLF